MTWEVAANLAYLISILLATRNSWHTWWTGIIGCLMFGWLFLQAKLYADLTLQGSLSSTSIYGWWHWLRGHEGAPAPIGRSSGGEIGVWAAAAIVGAIGLRSAAAEVHRCLRALRRLARVDVQHPGAVST